MHRCSCCQKFVDKTESHVKFDLDAHTSHWFCSNAHFDEWCEQSRRLELAAFAFNVVPINREVVTKNKWWEVM